MTDRHDLIERARAAERNQPMVALRLWAEAARSGSEIVPDRTGWDRRPAAVRPLRRTGPLPADMPVWAASASIDQLVGLIDEVERLTDFRLGFALRRAFAASGRDDPDIRFAAAYLSMQLAWKAQAYARALEAADAVLSMVGATPYLDDCGPPGPVFQAQSVRLRAALILGLPFTDFSDDLKARRPVAVARASLVSRWRRAPGEALGLAARVAMTGDPPAAAEVLCAWLSAELVSPDAGLDVARGLILRRRIQDDPTPPELCLAGASLFHRLGRNGHRQTWIDAYFDHYGLRAPRWPADAPSFDTIAGPSVELDQNAPLVTVAVSAFNASATIELAVRSLMAQSHGALEIIIVDDASTDDTLARVQALAAVDSRICVLTNPTNAGAYVSRNRALEAARGEFFTCLDADDWAHPRRIHRHVNAMRKDANLVATRSNWFRMTEDGEPAIRRSLGIFTHANPASPFFRTEPVRDTIGYYDRVRIDADLEHWLRLTTRFGLKQTARLRAPLTLGRLHAGSLTRSGAGAQDDEAYSPVRSEYRTQALAWRERALRERRLFMPAEPEARPFPAPAAMLPGEDL